VHELADVRTGGQELGDQVRSRELLLRLLAFLLALLFLAAILGFDD